MKNKNSILCLSILCFCFMGYAQLNLNLSPENYLANRRNKKFNHPIINLQDAIQQGNGEVEKGLYSFHISPLGLHFEMQHRLNKVFALRSAIGYGGFVIIDGSSLGLDSGWYPYPQITLEPRWYYNLKKRNLDSKPTKRNQGNFIGIQNNLFFKNSNNVQYTAYLIYGIRRSFKPSSKFYYEVLGGIGYQQYEHNRIPITLNVKLGYYIF